MSTRGIIAPAAGAPSGSKTGAEADPTAVAPPVVAPPVVGPPLVGCVIGGADPAASGAEPGGGVAPIPICSRPPGGADCAITDAPPDSDTPGNARPPPLSA